MATNQATTYDPRSERNPNRAVAQANTAAMALLRAIEKKLHSAHGATWAEAGDAIATVQDLAYLYAGLTNEEEAVEVTTDDGEAIRIEVTR